MAIKHQLQSSIYNVLKHNKDGSYSTQSNRKYILYQLAEELVKGGYQLRHIKGIKTKHVRYLVNLWQENQIKPATIKNRLAALNWLSDKLVKPNLVPSSTELGVEQRKYVTNQNKTITISDVQFDKLNHKGLQLSLKLERAFGLRREEALKIKPFLADKGDTLALQGSWCKNGRPRNIPIRTEAQRVLLEECKAYVAARHRSMIPDDKTYIQHLKYYERQVSKAGIQRAHGLRHAYAHERYLELTGFPCPAAGGPKATELIAEQKAVDTRARSILTIELGHARIQIVSIYLGR